MAGAQPDEAGRLHVPVAQKTSEVEMVGVESTMRLRTVKIHRDPPGRGRQHPFVTNLRGASCRQEDRETERNWSITSSK